MLALAFCAGPHRLALPVAQIECVLPPQQLQAVAGAPAAVVGLLAHADDLLPVVDMNRLLQVGADLGAGRMIVAWVDEVPRRRLVLLVQQAYDLIETGRLLPRLPLLDAPYLGDFSRTGVQAQLIDLKELLPVELRALARRVLETSVAP